MNSTSRRRSAAVSALASVALLTAACGGGGFDNSAGSATGTPTAEQGPVVLKMLIASSGDAETGSVKAAAAA